MVGIFFNIVLKMRKISEKRSIILFQKKDFLKVLRILYVVEYYVVLWEIFG